MEIDKEKLIGSYDLILNELDKYNSYESTFLLCNIINEHLKKVNAAIIHYNVLAEEAEESMINLADNLRTLRLKAHTYVHDFQKKVIRVDAEMRD